MLLVKILYPPTEHIPKQLIKPMNVLNLRLSAKETPPNNNVFILLTQN